MITLNKINAVFGILKCNEKGVAKEISEYFSFLVPGYQFSPKFKAKIWDGNIRLAKFLPNGDIEFPIGLLQHLRIFCKENNYSLDVNYDEEIDLVSTDKLKEFIDSLNIHSRGVKIEVRDYQFNGVLKFLNSKRLVLLSPTSCLDPDDKIKVLLDDHKAEISLKNLDCLIKDGYKPKIKTPSGYEYITDVYRKNGTGKEIFFSDESTLKAADNHRIWFNEEWTEIKDLSVNDKINNLDIIDIKPIDAQEWIDFSIDAEHESYYHNDILHHNSGKSLILYIIVRFLLEYKCKKGLLIVPNTSLCHQISSDFLDYSSHNGWNVEKNIHTIFSGKDKISDCPIYISTYQSLQKIKENSYFQAFDFVMNDECHLASASSITNILQKCTEAEYRIGVTGTLNGTKVHSLQLESLFGSIEKVITTKQLMDNNQVTQLKIKCLVLKYPDEIRKCLTKITYQEEIDFIVSNVERNKIIRNLAMTVNGNTLILFNLVEKHGLVLYNILLNSTSAHKKKIYFIHGNIDAKERENIRNAMETEDNVILIGSVGTVATGVNIKNLHNIIFAAPSKSRVRNLQAAGRILRLNENKTVATLYDFADNLSWKKHKNYTLKHFFERISIYNSEKFEYKIINLNIRKK